MRRYNGIAITAMLVISLAAIAQGNDCVHPGLLPDGTPGSLPGPCSTAPYGSPSFNPIPYSTLQATYDLDITYIERTPRYPGYCDNGGVPCEPTTVVNQCQGLLIDASHPTGKRWPDPGESVTYTAHVVNKGGQASSAYSYTWKENGVAVSGTGGTGSMPALGAGQQHLITLSRTWSNTPGTIELSVTPNQPDLLAVNNSLLVHTHALGLKIFVDQGIYNQFNQRQSAYSLTFSFEDWFQKHIARMNDLFQQAVYAGAAPSGILERVKIDALTVYSGNPAAVYGSANDPHFYCEDGNWTYDNTTVVGDIIDQVPHQNLIHELGHYLLGLVDLYRMNLPGGPNNGVQITPFVQVDPSGCSVSPPRSHPPLCQTIWEGAKGIMSGGDTFPYFVSFGGVLGDQGFFSKHDAAGINSDYGNRRWYFFNLFGAYTWDTPLLNYLRVLDDGGSPLAGATVKMYQKDRPTEIIDNTLEFPPLTTDANGIVQLPNQSVGTSVTTRTGHTLRDNPFGIISRFDENGTFLVRITSSTNEWFRWLTVHDLNLAYWVGNTDVAVHTVGPCTRGLSGQSDVDLDNDDVQDLCDNCVGTYNPTQRDRDHDGRGDECDPCPDLRTLPGTQCVRVNPSGDTYVSTSQGTTTYGSNTVLQVGRNAGSKGSSTPTLQRTFLAFNLSGSVPSNATVTQAVFHAYNITTFGYPPDNQPDATIWRNTGAFDEMTTRWDFNQPQNTTPPPAILWSLPVTSTPTWVSLDVTPLATDCKTNRSGQCSWQIRWADENSNTTAGAYFQSREASIGPYLEVAYTVP